mmetsp:Transcript_8936/g.17695  ORF Transcript_8936/g.17695 Transcript_8936/m.17695 type:complete len:378 (+) Transcript_8936:378-1511(+)
MSAAPPPNGNAFHSNPPQAADMAPVPQPAAANQAPGNAAHPSAMTLFAPGPSEGENQQGLDLDELFHDCYFGEFPVPDDITSGPADISLPLKRNADEAGLRSTQAPAAPISAAPMTSTLAPQAAPVPIPSAASSSKSVTAMSISESQKIERRERNREHAKRSRLRKKFLLESLQEQIDGLQSEIQTLKSIIRRELPDKANDLLKDLDEDEINDVSHPKRGEFTPLPMPSGFGPVKTLMEPDYRLMSALSGSQQNFAISDPSLPDNPIVYVSQGFLDLTGYTLDQVLGRNCRFLQGPGTDQAAVDVIRRGVREGVDTSVCLLNYKADGTPFWNQFFVAALRDAENNVVNFVGVQCEVSKAVVDKHIKEGKTPAPTNSS